MQTAVAITVEKPLHLRGHFVPTFLQRCFSDILGYRHVSGVQFTVADNAHLRYGGNLLAHELEDGTAKVPSNAFVRPGPLQFSIEEGVIQPLPAGGEALDISHHLLLVNPTVGS